MENDAKSVQVVFRVNSRHFLLNKSRQWALNRAPIHTHVNICLVCYERGIHCVLLYVDFFHSEIDICMKNDLESVRIVFKWPILVFFY